MHAPNMTAFQSLYLCKALRILSTRNPYTIIACYESRKFSRLPKRLHSTPHRRFPSSTDADESSVFSWTAFPSLPPPRPLDSLPPQTPTVHDPTTSRFVTRLEHNGSYEFPSDTEIAETFPSSTPLPVPVESLPRQNSTVQTVYDVTTGHVVTKRLHNGGKEVESGTEKAENISSTEVGTKVYGDVIGSNSELTSDTEKAENTFSSGSAFPRSLPHPVPVGSLPRQTSTVQTDYDVTTGRVVTKRVNNGSKEVDSGTEKAENISSTEVGTKVYGDVIGSSSVKSRVDTDISSSKKTGSRVYPNVIRSSGIRSKNGKKSRNVFVCSSCGYSDGQWWGSCRECGVVGTMTKFTTESVDQKSSGIQVSENAMRSWLPKEASPIKLNDVYSRINDTKWRMPIAGKFGAEVERVLGGGLVPGSLVLVGGDPGVGKSTLLLQIVALIGEGNDADSPGPVIYVSGEESVEQIANRADRLSIETENLFLYSSTDIEEIIEQAQRLSPKALVIDSIQTVYLKGVTGSAGGLSQVKECTSALLKFAKKTNIPVLLIGHVTKTGEIAGPRVLEHIVDVVLYLEGEKYSSHRLLRSVKNRFGPSDELGVFKMSQLGLEEVLNPSEMYLAEEHSDSDYPAGLAVTVIVDGSRAFLIGVQALCGAGSSAERPGSLVVRHLNGVQASRADMIISAIIKQAGLKLQANDIFLNVVNGVTLTETAGDLAIAAAVCSSFLEFPLPNGIAFVAEVGLAGELRMVPEMAKRINTLGKLGYKQCIVPKSAEKSLPELQPEGMEIVGCKNLKEMINTVFRLS